MAASSWIRKAGTWIPEFILSKFPYVQAITLVMLLAERAMKAEKYPPMHPKIIYTIAGVCLMAGVMMSAKIKVRFAALIYTGVLGYLALNAYTNKEFNYSKHVRRRISSRHLGCMGVYLIFSFIKSGQKSRLTQRVGELCIAVYLLSAAYLFNESYEDRRGLMENLLGGNYMRYFITLVYACSGLCFLSGYFLRDISMSMAFCLTFVTFLVDMKFTYWTYRGMNYWNQVRLTLDNANLLVGFFMFLTFYENLKVEEAEEENETQESNTEEEHTKSE